MSRQTGNEGMLNERGSLAVLLVAVLFVSVPASGAAGASLTTDETTHSAALTGGALADVPENLNETSDEVGETVDDVGNSVNETADDIGDSANETADDIGDSANETADDVGDSANETADDVGDSVNETADDVGDSVNETADDVGDSVNETADDVGDGVDGTVDGVAEETADSVDTAEGTSAIVERAADETTDAVDQTAADAAAVVDGAIDPSGVGTSGAIARLEARLLGAIEGLDSTTTNLGDSPQVPGASDGQSAVSESEGTETIDAMPTAVVSGEPESDAGPESESGPASDPDGLPSGGDSAGTAGDGNDGTGSSIPGGSSGAGVAIGAVLLGAVLVARDLGTAAALSAIAASGSPLLATIAALLRDWVTRVFALFGYKRYSDDDPLEHEARERLYEFVRSSPGSYLAEISEETEVPMQTARYHLRVLDFENLVDHESIRGRRRYFPLGTDCAELDAALNDDSTAAIIRTLDSDGPDSVSGLADRLDRDPSTISHHLDRLAENDLVERERDGRAVVNRLTSNAERALGAEATATTDSRVPGQAD